MFRIMIVLLLLAGPLGAKQILLVPSDTIPCDPTVKVKKTFCPSCEAWTDQFSPDFTDKLPVEFHLTIFNNENVEIFSTDDIDKGWTGPGKNNAEQTQTYRWVISYRYEKNGTLYRCSEELVLIQ